MDFQPTAEVIREMATVYRDRAAELDHLADDLVNNQDFSYAAAALSCVSSTSYNLRTDLLLTRPLRALGAHKGLGTQLPLRRKGKTA